MPGLGLTVLGPGAGLVARISWLPRVLGREDPPEARGLNMFWVCLT